MDSANELAVAFNHVLSNHVSNIESALNRVTAALLTLATETAMAHKASQGSQTLNQTKDTVIQLFNQISGLPHSRS